MASRCRIVRKFLFEHIKSGGRCPFSDRLISQLESDLHLHIDQDNISPLLVQILDKFHGTEEIVNNRRKVMIIDDYTNDDSWKCFRGGSVGDGFVMKTSDIDMMKIMTNVVVTYPDQIHLIPSHSLHKTILLMREADSRPGYLNLEISQIAFEEGGTVAFQNAIVPIGDSMFLSSDIYRQCIVDMMYARTGDYVSNGPCTTSTAPGEVSIDIADGFPCVCWPREANEWILRTLLHGWPTQTMIDRIVQDGCHLVPVGDKCSTDTLLQWRISFACAENLLVHSLTHPQFRVYGLLKYFLTQIKDLLDHMIGDSDVLCSYFIKTVIFHAVESSPYLLWDEQNTFLCFRFCLIFLIAWVKSGQCPNYFIRNNNMFLRKVHGENRQKLLHVLKDLYDLKWMCFSIESVNEPYIGLNLQQNQRMETSELSECMRDLHLFGHCVVAFLIPQNRNLYASLKCFHAHTDVDEYYETVSTLYNIADEKFNEYNTSRSNKHKYIALKKYKQLLAPVASICTSPGLMILATFHYLTGNYRKALQMCADMMSTFRLFIYERIHLTQQYCEPYQRRYCGKGYTYYHKLKGVNLPVSFTKKRMMMCLPHLHLEVKKNNIFSEVIPPVPYATFLSFQCNHELGDMRRRDTELINLRAANYDPEQGGHNYWIVHTLLGICYQTVGDNRRAIRSFTDSLRVKPERNPAIERIEALRRSQ